MSSKVKTWNATAPQFLTESKLFDRHVLGVTSLDIDTTDRYLATGGLDGHIRLWDLNTNSIHKDINSGPLGCWKLGFINKGTELVTVSEAGIITIYSTETGEKTRSISNTSKQILNMALSPNGEQMAIAGTEGVVSVFELESGKKINSFKAHSAPIRALCFSSDSKNLFTGSDDSQIRFHDLNSSTPYIASFLGHSSNILCVNASKDGKRLASSGSIDRKVCIWDIKTRKLDYTFNVHADNCWDLAWSPDSTKLISVSDDCSVISYSLTKQ